LEQIFPDALRQLVTICITPSGTSGDGLSRVEEYALFCFLGGTQPNRIPDDLLSAEKKKSCTDVAWESLLRRGNAWYRKARKNLCYPVLIDDKTQRIVGVGKPFSGKDEAKRPTRINGCFAAWPVRTDSRLGIWRVDGAKLLKLAGQGFAYASAFDETRNTWSIKYLMAGSVKAIAAGKIEITGRGKHGEAIVRATELNRVVPKTMWHRGRHNAGGNGGTQALTALLGQRDLFPFPKSVYSVYDTLEIATANRKNALVLDFFAGSGTTYHATCLLNAADAGSRRCILVTNNEVRDGVASQLNGEGHFAGDSKFEAAGIAESVTWPRCYAVTTGKRPDGKTAEGAGLDGREYSLGFEEGIEYFRLDFLDPDDVARGDAFQAVLPILWMMAGCIGEREESKGSQAWFIPARSPFGVLIKENEFLAFRDKLAARDDIEWAFLVTDSEENFGLMRRALERKVHCVQLYKSYLENFRLNTPEALGTGGSS
jgi:adenine-specific DNA-methyltransferase